MAAQGITITSVTGTSNSSQVTLENTISNSSSPTSYFLDSNVLNISGTTQVYPSETDFSVLVNGIAPSTNPGYQSGNVFAGQDGYPFYFTTSELASGDYIIAIGQDPIIDPNGTDRIHIPSGSVFGTVTGYQNISSEYSFILSREKTPVITQVMDNANGLSVPIADGGHTSNTTPIIQGTAEPNSTIDIFDNGFKIGQTSTPATYTSDGWAWSFTPSTALDMNTTHVFSIDSKNNALSGISSDVTPGSETYSVAINSDSPGPLAPVITFVQDITTLTTIPDGSKTTTTRPDFQGTGEPGTIVTIFDNGTAIGTVTAGDNGDPSVAGHWVWVFQPTIDLTTGIHNISVTASRSNLLDQTTPALYNYIIDVEPSLDTVLANAGLSAAAPAVAPAAATPSAQAAYVSPSAHVADALHHDLAY